MKVAPVGLDLAKNVFSHTAWMSAPSMSGGRPVAASCSNVQLPPCVSLHGPQLERPGCQPTSRASTVRCRS